jgi:monoamine oxidase
MPYHAGGPKLAGRDSMNEDIDVVIIGGGAAGIGAARTLAASECSTLMLEASSRLGGRAWTVEIAGHRLDLGCGWLHSGDRNSWRHIAEEAGVTVDRRPAKWGVQYRNLCFSPDEQKAARAAFAAWMERLTDDPPPSDRAADALPKDGEWNGYVRAIGGFISGATLDRVSVADYLTYDAAATDVNLRAPNGYGDLIVASLPPQVALRLSTPIEGIELEPRGVALRTERGAVHARAAILTPSTTVLAREAIKAPKALDPWREAASSLPLGRNEKLFLEIVGQSPFAPETHELGNPRDPSTAAYYIRPFGRNVVECFFGGEGAQMIEDNGPVAGFDRAIGELAALFGTEVRRCLKPLVGSSWSRTTRIGGAYSYALPGQAAARKQLARPFEDRLFFAGEATNESDFSTAHGAHDSGVRAAQEALAALRPGTGRGQKR